MAFISIPGKGSSEWKASVDTAGDLPASGILGEIRLVQNPGQLFFWDGASWQALTSGGAGLASLNGQVGTSQTFATGTAGIDFGISSAGNVHTFNLPNASASARGVLTTGAQSLGGVKTFNDGANLGSLELKKLSSAVVLNDNTTAVFLSYPKTNEFVIMEYSVSRQTGRRIGRMLIVNNGTTISVVDEYNEQDIGTGNSFSAVVNGSNIDVSYTLSGTGFNGSLKYATREWA